MPRIRALSRVFSPLPSWASVIVLVLLAAPAVPKGAADEGAAPIQWFVSPAGDDANVGSSDKPFATLTRARDAVREFKRTALNRDVTVWVRGGYYTLSAALEFGPEDSGTDRHSITYAAWPGETPIISGGRTLRGWTKVGDAWQVEIPEAQRGTWRLDQLFVGGERRRRACSPNEGCFRVAEAGPDNRTSFRAARGDLPPLQNLAGLQVLLLHDWSVSRVGVSALDADREWVTLRHPIGAKSAAFFAIVGFEPHPRYRLENAAELLDAPGEWHLDRQSGILRYLPLPNEDLNRLDVVAPVLDRLLVVGGQSGDRSTVRNVRFVGLTFAYAATPRSVENYAGIQAGFHEARDPADGGLRPGRMPAAVAFDSTHDCRFEQGRIAHVGAGAISFEGPAEGNALVGSEIVDVGGNGVMVGEPSTAIQSLAKDNLIANNRIHRCGTVDFGCVGVWAGITSGTRIEHNEIHDLPYTGISVGWVWNATPSPCRNNRVESNHIHHVMQTLSDGGGIYTLGRQQGTVLRGNLIHDVPVNAGRAESNGLFIDEGSSEFLIERNTIYDVARSPIRFHRALNNVVRDNVLVPPPQTPVFRYNSTDESSMALVDNQTPERAQWTPPTPRAANAGLEPPYDQRLAAPAAASP